jgi:intraflagellar transport protein 80
LQNLNTPIIFDIKAPPAFMHLCKKHFLTLDQISGLQVISYEGRVLSQPRFQGLRAEYLTQDMVALSPDTVVVVDSVDSKNVQILDATGGRALSRLTHSVEVLNVCLNQHTLGPQERLMAFADRNRDLFIASLAGGPSSSGKGTPLIPTFKLHAHVESFIFNDETDVLVGLADGVLKAWYQPNVAFVDRDLLPLTVNASDSTEFGRSAHIISYTANRVSVRKVDGAVVVAATPPELPLFYDMVRGQRWDEAIRLCRHQKSSQLWVTLASAAIAKKNLDTAEIALAEVNEIPKVPVII